MCVSKVLLEYNNRVALTNDKNGYYHQKFIKMRTNNEREIEKKKLVFIIGIFFVIIKIVQKKEKKNKMSKRDFSIFFFLLFIKIHN